MHFSRPGGNRETSLGLIPTSPGLHLLARSSHGYQLGLTDWSCLRDLTGRTIRNHECHRTGLTLTLTSIVHFRIVPYRQIYWHCFLRIESKILGEFPHHNPFIAQFVLVLLILQLRVVLRYWSSNRRSRRILLLLPYREPTKRTQRAFEV